MHTLIILFPHGFDVIDEKISKPAGRLDVRVESNPSLLPKAFQAGFSNLFLPRSNVIICFLYEELKYYIALLNTIEKTRQVIIGNGRKAESRTNLFFSKQGLLCRPSKI